MFLYLSKYLPPLLYPLGLTFLLLLAAVFLRRRRQQQAVLLVALVVLYLGSNTWVSEALARPLEWRYLPDGEIPGAEVIVLLAGGTESGDYPRPGVEVDGAGDRLIHTARLYQQGKAPLILLSGGRIDWISSGPPIPEDMASLLELMGVPRSALWFEPDSRNTYESALACKALLEERGIRRVILVTSAWHMPRSVALFRHQGIEVIPAPTDFIATRPATPQPVTLASLIYDALPSPESLGRTTLLLKEYLGLLIYRLRGWI